MKVFDILSVIHDLLFLFTAGYKFGLLLEKNIQAQGISFQTLRTMEYDTNKLDLS